MSGIELSIPGWKDLNLRHLVLDVNGTIALDGRLLDGVSVRIRQLGELLQVHLLTADTHGRQSEVDTLLGVIRARILRLLVRRGLLSNQSDEGLDEEEAPPLHALYAASVRRRVAMGRRAGATDRLGLRPGQLCLPDAPLPPRQHAPEPGPHHGRSGNRKADAQVRRHLPPEALVWHALRRSRQQGNLRGLPGCRTDPGRPSATLVLERPA